MKETIKKKKINKDERKIKIILGIMLILFVLTLASFVMLITKLFEKKEEPKVPYVTGIEKNEKLVERLKGKSEYARMKIYLGDIVKKYPYIKEYMPLISPEYKRLLDPIQYMMMSKIATLQMIAMRGELELDYLIMMIEAKIDEEENK